MNIVLKVYFFYDWENEALRKMNLPNTVFLLVKDYAEEIYWSFGVEEPPTPIS